MKDTGGGFHVHVYSSGNNIAQTITQTINGNVYYGQGKQKQEPYSDEEIAQALLACIGEDKVINNMRKWAGAYWCLRWKCNYPVDIKDFCVKINTLDLNLPDNLQCDYNNIRKFCKLSFLDYDPFGKAEVRVSTLDREVYAWCREVAYKLAEELGKSYLQNR